MQDRDAARLSPRARRALIALKRSAESVAQRSMREIEREVDTNHEIYRRILG